MASADDKTGTDWSVEENRLIVRDYFEMLRHELQGEPYVKAEHNSHLRKRIKRSKGSIEFKHQNISAVLQVMEHPYINGYKPRLNFQTSLFEAVAEQLRNVQLPDWVNSVNVASLPLAIDAQAPAFQNRESNAAKAQRIIRAFNPVEQDERNRKLGYLGEQLVLLHEKQKLEAAGLSELASAVRWVAQVDGDGAGYDIQSFEHQGSRRGKELFLEVKTTSGAASTAFYLSENERQFAAEESERYRLIRVYDFFALPRAFHLYGPLENSVHLRAINYRAEFS